MTKILAFAGSTRKDSFNKKLVKVAAMGAQEAGAEVTYIDLADFPMPLFDEDLEAEKGMPEHAQRFKNLMLESDGFLISSPEYNGAYSAVLKNAIDWASRGAEGEPILAAFRGKTASLMATSPGAIGGLRGLGALSTLLSGVGVLILPNQKAVGKAHEKFNEDGTMTSEKMQANVMKMGADLVATIEKLQG
ncbi:NADPH-dependent oxidoreductase [Alteromonadaceae bacterium M269]|nr:NADPH-dependent oxidoreductase [Alteromonadaceae bacterium M269]